MDNAVSRDEQDKFLLDKLTTPKELSGMLNHALGKLKQLLDEDDFSYKNTPEQNKALMETYMGSCEKFFQEVLFNTPDKKITKAKMYEAYCDFCEKNNLPKVSMIVLGKKIVRSVDYAREMHKTERCWVNIDLSKHGLGVDEVDYYFQPNARKIKKQHTLNKNNKLNKKEVVKKSTQYIQVGSEKKSTLSTFNLLNEPHKSYCFHCKNEKECHYEKDDHFFCNDCKILLDSKK